MGNCTNTHEMRVLALKRSGNHAIVQWMVDNMKGRHCFLNNCRPAKSPFHKPWIIRHGRNGEQNHFTNIEGFDVDQECKGKHCQKDYLLYSYEDRTFDEINDTDVVSRRDEYVGTSENRLDVMIMRDPFNNLASKIRMSYDKNKYVKHWLKREIGLCREYAGKVVGYTSDSEDEFESELIRARDKRAFVYRDAKLTAELWKAYAREIIGETNHCPNLVWISYNRWFNDHEYRSEMAETLNLAGSDGGLDRVAAWGAGSSFDNLSLDGRACDMQVLERWKRMLDDEIYRVILQDPEIHELSQQLFGEFPGTEELLGQHERQTNTETVKLLGADV